MSGNVGWLHDEILVREIKKSSALSRMEMPTPIQHRKRKRAERNEERRVALKETDYARSMQSFRFSPEAVGKRPFLHMCKNANWGWAERRGNVLPHQEEGNKVFCLGEGKGQGRGRTGIRFSQRRNNPMSPKAARADLATDPLSAGYYFLFSRSTSLPPKQAP